MVFVGVPIPTLALRLTEELKFVIVESKKSFAVTLIGNSAPTACG